MEVRVTEAAASSALAQEQRKVFVEELRLGVTGPIYRGETEAPGRALEQAEPGSELWTPHTAKPSPGAVCTGDPSTSP